MKKLLFSAAGATAPAPQMLSYQKLISSDEASGDYFGFDVALSADGNYLAVGAYADDNSNGANAGSVYIFVRSGSTWVEQARLQSADVVASALFGSAVALDTTGSYLIVGAPGTGNGAAYIFTRSGSTWTQQAKLVASDGAATDYFGCSVSIGPNANEVAIGAYLDDTTGGSNSGSVYIFTRSVSTWSQQTRLQASNAAANDYFGVTVSLTTDVGNTANVTLAVGAQYAGPSDAGAVYVFRRVSGTWSQQTIIDNPDSATGGSFGFSVSLSLEGNTLAVGSWGQVSNTGCAYVYEWNGSSWIQQVKIAPADGVSGDYFGYDVALNSTGNTLIVGSPYVENNSWANVGAVYAYTRSGSVWSLQNKFILDSPTLLNQNHWLGRSVAVMSDGNIYAVGAPRNNEIVTDGGAVYVISTPPASDFVPPSVWTNSEDLSKSTVYWGVTYNGDTNYTQQLIYGNSTIVAIGGNFNDSKFFCSVSTDDGVTWTRNEGLSALVSPFNIAMVSAFGSGRFVVAFIDATDPGTSTRCYTSTDGITWSRNTSFETALGGRTPQHMTFGNGRFLVGLNDGYLLTSTNGTSWTLSSAALTASAGQPISSLSWTNNRYIGTANNYIITSTDSTTWTHPFDLSTNTSWSNQANAPSPYVPVLWNGSRYAVVGSQGGVMSSTNLTSWTYTNVSTVGGWGNDQASALFLSGTSLCAVSSFGAIIKSNDGGLSWFSPSGTRPEQTYWNTYNPNNWVSTGVWTGTSAILGASAGAALARSTDLSNWSYNDGLAGALSSWGRDRINSGFAMMDNGSTLVAVGTDNNCATSPDGITWTIQRGIKTAGTPFETGIGLYAGMWDGSKFIAAGTSGYMYTSTNGVTWSQQTVPGGWWVISDIAKSPSIMVVVGTKFGPSGYTGKISYSTDSGATWNATSDISPQLFCVCYASGKFVAGGQSGSIFTSTDGINWNLTSTIWSSGINSIEWDGTKFLAVGGASDCATSPDGITWTYQDGLKTVNPNISKVYWSGDMFIGYGAGSSICYSYDGISWADQSTGLRNTWGGSRNGSTIIVRAAHWYNNRFILLGNNSLVATFS